MSQIFIQIASYRDPQLTTTIFDCLEKAENPGALTTAIWVGTNDTGATDDDPGNGGEDGNNMRPILLDEYDNGEDEGDGHLTKERRPIDDTSGNDRITTYAYDYRGRRVQSEAHDGTRLFLSVTVFDNIDESLSVTSYHTSVANGNRIRRTESLWDQRRRVFLSKTWGVDPASGDLTEALTAGTWYDPNGNVIEQSAAGSGQVTKTEFDALNRPVRVARVVPGAPI